ncbi:GNAT family N-acetyltransferase [Microbacterium sp. RD1]|uniref:GNAT family N-acetyltransferase n=1 Tax=Microbacterium sp. RD1 TaxID=3457313 RepID=UPI003FA5F968
MARVIQADPLVGTALHDAERAAAGATVSVRELTSVADQAASVRLLSDIWARSAQNPPVPTELLRALSKAGNYIAGAFSGVELVGVAIGFHSDPGRHALHSHIAGVSPAYAGRSVGYALKLHQRAWALQHGIDTIEWTFDPLVSRNAYFNIVKLGALPVEYLPNFYGEIEDGVNTDDETDRLLVRWQLLSEEARAAAAGSPRRVDPTGAGVVSVEVPPDIVAIRHEDPPLAQSWRRTVRARMTELLDAGGRVVGFDRATGYLIQQAGDEKS